MNGDRVNAEIGQHIQSRTTVPASSPLRQQRAGPVGRPLRIDNRESVVRQHLEEFAAITGERHVFAKSLLPLSISPHLPPSTSHLRKSACVMSLCAIGSS